MCGRFTLAASPDELLLLLPELQIKEEFQPRYNIAPSQDVSIIKNESAIELTSARWGLIPNWSKDTSIGNKLINARSESLKDKPSFCQSFKHRRCLIPASGFYEWKTIDKRTKQPMYIRLKSCQPFMFAGLWDIWDRENTITSCTIVTTCANNLIKRIHHRMPVILPSQNYRQWLDSELTDTNYFSDLLLPYPADEMMMFPVSTAVNSVRFDDPSCIEPTFPESEQSSLF